MGPSEFSSVASPLLEYRRRQGLTVKFTATEDIFSEFGFGESRPEAIRDFIQYAYEHWRGPRLRYVLLLGDATYDFKDYLQTGVRNQLPPLLVKTSYLWTVSDPTLAAVHGEDILPDLAIGRLPAGNPEELRILVEKILAYETGNADLEGPLVLVTDNPDQAGDFDANAEEIARGVLSGREVRRLSLRELGSSTRDEILSAFDGGASLVSYVGHGGIHLWADENVFNTADVRSLSHQSREPILLTMNCLNGYFHFPYFDSLAEALLKAEGKGAIAAFSPSGLSLDGPAHRFHLALLDALFNQGHRRLGDAVLAAQKSYSDSGAYPELLTIYHLLGDPALS
ncbi:MAG: C25 family cysteine peptidase, partial [Vicinamibacteria bacterium]